MAAIAFYAARIANKGLNTWNRQLKGGSEYDLARRILKCTYRWREALANVRNPLITSEEQPSPSPEKAKDMTHLELSEYGVATAYQNRWDKVVAIRDELRAELLEAEALWDDTFVKSFEPLFDLQHKLFSTLHAYLRARNPSEHPDSRKVYQEIYMKGDAIMYRSFSKDVPDQFGSEVDAGIKIIEAHLKPHLREMAVEGWMEMIRKRASSLMS